MSFPIVAPVWGFLILSIITTQNYTISFDFPNGDSKNFNPLRKFSISLILHIPDKCGDGCKIPPSKKFNEQLPFGWERGAMFNGWIAVKSGSVGRGGKVEVQSVDNVAADSCVDHQERYAYGIEYVVVEFAELPEVGEGNVGV